MPKNMTVAEIKEELDALGIGYDTKAKKAELVKLLETETVESVEEVIEVEPETYVVLRDFKDLEDKGFIYIKDDLYPRKSNTSVTKERVKQLSTTNNKIGKILIKKKEQE